jgi:Phospholipase A1
VNRRTLVLLGAMLLPATNGVIRNIRVVVVVGALREPMPLGNGDLVARHQTEGGYVSSLLVRRRFVQLDWATPLLAALGVARLHVQLSSGYGESLIDW